MGNFQQGSTDALLSIFVRHDLTGFACESHWKPRNLWMGSYAFVDFCLNANCSDCLVHHVVLKSLVHGSRSSDGVRIVNILIRSIT
jgi:hypothetical protein